VVNIASWITQLCRDKKSAFNFSFIETGNEAAPVSASANTLAVHAYHQPEGVHVDNRFAMATPLPLSLLGSRR
jgi:hypothetical protein